MRTTGRVMIVAAGAISLGVAAAASAAASTGAAAVATAWPAAQGMTTGVGPAAAWGTSAIGAARPAGVWGRAGGVPGLVARNKGGYASVSSVSCASAGNCAAGGYYAYRHHHSRGFVAVERHGRWGTAIEVPGLAALNKGGAADVSSVSCASAGNCAAGGEYLGRHGRSQAFVVSQDNGTWGRAIEVPGLAALNKGGDAYVNSVSCASAGNCSAGGYYSGRGSGAFVVSQRKGAWGKAQEVTGTAALSKGDGAQINSVSCGSAGSCAAGGDYTDGDGNGQGFVAVERHGRWGRAIEVPGLGALNTGGGAEVLSVSCASAGSCAAGGYYIDFTPYSFQGFVAVERHGRWGTAIEVPGLGTLNKGGSAYVYSVSCASAGNCAAGGAYTDGDDNGQGFVAVERHGRWGTAIEVPGLGALNKGRNADLGAGVSSLSCVSAGSCAAGGGYQDRHGHEQGFVAVERDGSWGTAIEVPGLGTLNKGGNADVNSVSCATAGSCAAGGDYANRFRHPQHLQGFVT